jgi:uncharacterized membrane protein
MFGIRGLDPFGLVHALIGIAALLVGFAVLVSRKGTRRHRLMGRWYVAAMVVLNLTALMIYDLFGRFGPFHVAALVSLATTIAGFVPAYRRRPPVAWMERHAVLMCWSYVGLLAAFIAEIAARVPGVGFGPAVAGATAITIGGGAILIHTRIARAILRLVAAKDDALG